MLLKFNNVSYKYPEAASQIFEGINLQFSEGFTGIIGSNGSGKSTLLKLAATILKPTSGSVKYDGIIYYCEQRTDEQPTRSNDFIFSFEKHSYKIRKLLGVDEKWFDRWDTLSHGERKRCQIGTALFLNPNILLIDEPTNHIDSNTRVVLVNALKSFKGIGLIVSHDRELLDELCNYTLSLDQTDKKNYRGNYSSFENEMEKEYQHLTGEKDKKIKQIKKLEREVKHRKRKASEADSKRSKRNIFSKDHDAKSKIDMARLTGKDATEGKIYTKLKNRMDNIINEKDKLGSTAKRELGIHIDGSKSAKRILYYETEQTIDLGNQHKLLLPDLSIGRSDKIGLSGPNGYGKSTLVNRIAKSLSKSSTRAAYIPQEISSVQSKALLEKVKRINTEGRGKIFTIISRLNSDPKRLLDSELPSPGEVRKLNLAKAMMNECEIIIMDEPTNHMDLSSIQCVEEALRDFSAALILVSHDNVFLKNIVNVHWTIGLFRNNSYRLKIF